MVESMILELYVLIMLTKSVPWLQSKKHIKHHLCAWVSQSRAKGKLFALPVDAELCQELDRRWSAHLQNPTAALAWDQVRSQLGLG